MGPGEAPSLVSGGEPEAATHKRDLRVECTAVSSPAGGAAAIRWAPPHTETESERERDRETDQ